MQGVILIIESGVSPGQYWIWAKSTKTNKRILDHGKEKKNANIKLGNDQGAGSTFWWPWLRFLCNADLQLPKPPGIAKIHLSGNGEGSNDLHQTNKCLYSLTLWNHRLWVLETGEWKVFSGLNFGDREVRHRFTCSPHRGKNQILLDLKEGQRWFVSDIVIAD